MSQSGSLVWFWSCHEVLKLRSSHISHIYKDSPFLKPPQPFRLIKAQLETRDVFMSLNYYSLSRQNRPLTVLPCGYGSNITHYRIIMHILSTITACGRANRIYYWEQLVKCQSSLLQSLLLTQSNPPSSLCLRTHPVSGCVSFHLPFTPASIQSRLNIGQHSLKSSSIWKFDKCTPGGSGLNIIFVIGGRRYPPLKYSEY